jgi:redox-sensitive bicupin YhaK (pirin superfamily)
MSDPVSRPVARVVRARRTVEGGGFVVRRPFPTPELDLFDPFLLLDEMGPVTYGPGEAVGAPDHPHRGFETVTYLLDGEVEHEDSAGNRAVIHAGDVQWMTAGAGVIHSEMPVARIREHGGRVHGFQIWVNLPASDKRAPPGYQEVRRENMPTATSADGRATVKVIAGEAGGVAAHVRTRTPILLFDIALRPGADLAIATPGPFAVAAYVYQGDARVGPTRTHVPEGGFVVLADGSEAQLGRDAGDDGESRVLLLGGEPLREPVARYGPFVMNTEAEIVEAIRDYQSGRFAAIAR